MNAFILHLDSEESRYLSLRDGLAARGLAVTGVKGLASPENRNAAHLAGHLAMASMARQRRPGNFPTFFLEVDAILPEKAMWDRSILHMMDFPWDGLILGCDILKWQTGPSPWLCKPLSVTQSHAYAISAAYLDTYIDWLVTTLPKKLAEATYGPHTLDLAWGELFARDKWLAFRPPLALQDSPFALPWWRSMNSAEREQGKKYGWAITV